MVPSASSNAEIALLSTVHLNILPPMYPLSWGKTVPGELKIPVPCYLAVLTGVQPSLLKLTKRTATYPRSPNGYFKARNVRPCSLSERHPSETLAEHGCITVFGSPVGQTDGGFEGAVKGECPELEFFRRIHAFHASHANEAFPRAPISLRFESSCPAEKEFAGSTSAEEAKRLRLSKASCPRSTGMPSDSFGCKRQFARSVYSKLNSELGTHQAVLGQAHTTTSGTACFAISSTEPSRMVWEGPCLAI